MKKGILGSLTPYLIIAICVFVVYLPALNNGFTNWDDEVYVLENVWLRQHTFQRFKELFTIYHAGNYHPLTMVLYWLIFYFARTQHPEIYHLVNVILHTANTILVFILLREFVSNTWICVMFAVLWGVHPMRVESVAWISELKDVLYSLFYLSGIILFVRCAKKNKISTKEILIISILHLLALLSKPAAVALPLSLIALLYYFRSRHKAFYVLLGITLILSFIFGIVTIQAQKSAHAIADRPDLTPLHKIIIALHNIAFYLIYFFYPLQQSHFYPYPDFRMGIPIQLLIFAFAGIVFLVVVAILAWKRKLDYAVMGAGFFLANIVLILQIISVGNAITADRYTYMAHLGIIIPLAIFISKKPNIHKKIWFLITFFIYAGILITKTTSMIKIWKDGETLWKHFIKVYPQHPYGYYHLAGWFAEFKGDYDNAFHNYMKAIKISPNWAEAYIYIGNIYGIKGKLDSAIYYYNKAEQLGEANFNLYVNKGIAYSLLGKVDSALHCYTTAIKKAPRVPTPYINRSILYMQIGELTKALDDINMAIFLSPDNPELYLRKATILEKMSKYNEAYSELMRYYSMMGNRGISPEATQLLTRLKEKISK